MVILQLRIVDAQDQQGGEPIVVDVLLPVVDDDRQLLPVVDLPGLRRISQGGRLTGVRRLRIGLPLQLREKQQRTGNERRRRSENDHPQRDAAASAVMASHAEDLLSGLKTAKNVMGIQS